MESPPQYLPLTAFLPHRPPMLLLDRLLEHGEAHAVCEAHVVSDGLFVDEGGVSALIALELFAQAAAAHIGYEWYVRGDAAGLRAGALLGTRRIDLLVDRLTVGDRLVVRATHVMSMPPVAQYEGTLFREGEVIASGTISVAAGVG
jgi:predicted hotdog family 3-hydroxylacyl-ACP dehydratase